MIINYFKVVEVPVEPHTVPGSDEVVSVGYEFAPAAKLFKVYTDGSQHSNRPDFYCGDKKPFRFTLKTPNGEVTDRSTRFDSCSLLVREETKTEEVIEKRTVGLFRKREVEERKTIKRTAEIPCVEGLYVLGAVGQNGEIWYRNGYERIVLDEKTMLPRLSRQPQTIDEAEELIMVDPRYIEFIDVSSEFITSKDSVTYLAKTAVASVRNFLEYQSKLGVQFDEQERTNREKFIALVYAKIEQFKKNYEALHEVQDDITI